MTPKHVQQELARHLIDPAPDDLRAQRMWRGVRARIAARTSVPRRRRLVPTVFVSCAIAAAVAIVIAGRHREGATVAASYSAGPWSGARDLRLPDGSRLRLDANARVRVTRFEPKQVDAVVEVGGVDFDVPEAAHRSFRVTAGLIEVRVLGTAFRVQVASDASTLTVSVSRGTAELHRGAAPPIILAAGEQWTGDLSAKPSLAPTSPPPAQLPPTIEARRAAPPRSSPTRVARAAPDPAAGLFAAADRAWIEGRPTEALAGFEALRRQHPAAATSALAAVQIGRIRLDHLHDAAGALRAFYEARALAPNAPFREDLDARIVDALDRLGDRAACARARDELLARHPTGLHASAVRLRCSGAPAPR